MQQVVIENPVINSPFVEPKRHFRFTEQGITNEIVDGRRVSSYFIPIPRAKKKNSKQMAFETEWTADRIEENKLINKIRERVAVWRQGGYVGITKTTAQLLEYWKRDDRGRRLFFCQIEALETVIYITEVASKYGDAWIENDLHRANEDSTVDPKPGPTPTHVRALEDRIACEITFPRVIGYRYDLPGEKLSIKFTDKSRLALSTRDLPTKTEMSSIVGEASFHTLYGLKTHREQEIDFLLSKLILEKYFRDDQKSPKVWLFPQLLAVARQWREQCVTCKDDAFPQMLLLAEFAHDAADRIYHAIVTSTNGEKTLKPILRPYDTVGSTRYVDFDTTRPVYTTNAKKCHISHVVADTESWEQKMAQTLEDMPEVVCYVKNQNLGFTIPYTLAGEERQYIPDFIVRMDDGHGNEDLLNLIVEVSGEARKDKAAKVGTARTLWLPAINSHGGYGRWTFVEIGDPWDAKKTIRASLSQNLKAAAS